MLSYTIGFRQGLSYTFRTFSTSIWTIWIPSGYHLVIGKWKVAVIQGYRSVPGDGIPGILAPAGPARQGTMYGILGLR